MAFSVAEWVATFVKLFPSRSGKSKRSHWEWIHVLRGSKLLNGLREGNPDFLPLGVPWLSHGNLDIHGNGTINNPLANYDVPFKRESATGETPLNLPG